MSAASNGANIELKSSAALIVKRWGAFSFDPIHLDTFATSFPNSDASLNFSGTFR